MMTYLSEAFSQQETQKLAGEPQSPESHRLFRPTADKLLRRRWGPMEHTSFGDQRNATFTLTKEDHTLANALRFTLNQDPRVLFCGYSILHPSEARVSIRVQTTGDPAREVLKDACQDLMLMCRHGRTTFDNAVADFKKETRGRVKLQSSWPRIDDGKRH